MMAVTDADAIRLSPADNVATVLRAVTAGQSICVQCGDRAEMLTATESVPFCHKISLAAIAPGELVWKYGEVIGVATGEIRPGVHVHVHNLASRRGKGTR